MRAPGEPRARLSVHVSSPTRAGMAHAPGNSGTVQHHGKLSRGRSLVGHAYARWESDLQPSSAPRRSRVGAHRPGTARQKLRGCVAGPHNQQHPPPCPPCIGPPCIGPPCIGPPCIGPPCIGGHGAQPRSYGLRAYIDGGHAADGRYADGRHEVDGMHAADGRHGAVCRCDVA